MMPPPFTIVPPEVKLTVPPVLPMLPPTVMLLAPVVVRLMFGAVITPAIVVLSGPAAVRSKSVLAEPVVNATAPESFMYTFPFVLLAVEMVAALVSI